MKTFFLQKIKAVSFTLNKLKNIRVHFVAKLKIK